MPRRVVVIPPRAAAAGVVAAVLRGRSLDPAVAAARKRVAAADAALVQQLAYGAVRYWYRLEPVVAERLRRPLKRRDGDLRALLVVALYELLDMRTPPHAAVDAAVEATAALGKDWARGLVNGLLRGVLRTPDALAPSGEPAHDHAWPVWLATALAADWPRAWPQIAASATARAPMVLRVNTRRGGIDAYAERLAAAGIEARRHEHAEQALVLAWPVDVEALPGFGAGDVSVQDAAAQLAAPLLAPVDGLRVLDACAAPGGKTGHIAELGPPAELVAVERDRERAAELGRGLARLGVDARVISADAGRPADWWDGRAFDRILLDVPCSATGVIRRHPDIRLLRRPGDIAGFAAEQDRLLAALWPLLAPGGMLVYTTCSVLRRENAERPAAFERAGARWVVPPLACGLRDGEGLQVLPGEAGMDGFFYACLRRD